MPALNNAILLVSFAFDIFCFVCVDFSFANNNNNNT